MVSMLVSWPPSLVTEHLFDLPDKKRDGLPEPSLVRCSRRVGLRRSRLMPGAPSWGVPAHLLRVRSDGVGARLPLGRRTSFQRLLAGSRRPPARGASVLGG